MSTLNVGLERHKLAGGRELVPTRKIRKLKTSSSRHCETKLNLAVQRIVPSQAG